MVRGGMTGYCRGGFRMDALMSVKLISLLSPKGLREGNPGVLELEIDGLMGLVMAVRSREGKREGFKRKEAK